ncbi:MAG: hypothetical protein LBR20_04200 [Propionibacteriaceae bacterium]|jgi:hypothetical protein|nr:hypothetical protein [Propionibacteriaceae bacterium]
MRKLAITALATALCLGAVTTAVTTTAAAPPVPAATFAVAPNPTISGSATVGAVLTAVEGTWVPTPDGFAYQWYRNNQPILGANARSYRVQAADYQTALSVGITAYKAGYDPRSTGSLTATPLIGPGTFTATPAPTISGTVRVGSKLTVKTGTWKPLTPSFSVQWYLNGKAIPGATGRSYTLKAAAKGKKLTVAVSAVSAGFPKVTKTSKAKKVAAGKLTAPTPKLSGSAKKGATLKLTVGKWKPSGVKLKVQWYRSGKKISGATKRSYKVVAADQGKKITAKVTGSKSGYTTLTKTTAAKSIAAKKSSSSSGSSSSGTTPSTPTSNCKTVAGKQVCT